MIPIQILSLIVTSSPGPSVVVLQPVEDCVAEGKSRIVPIWIGNADAVQLSFALNKTKLSRPATHDLFLDAITNLDACVDHVVINDAKGAMFFAQLTLRQHGRLISLDARPSDALSLAIRQHAPLYIDESVLERSSFPYIKKVTTDKASVEKELEEFHSFITNLAPSDFKDEF